MKRKKGMTLLEIIISLAIFSILFVGGSLIIKTIVEENVMSAQRQQARAIAQDVIEELKGTYNVKNAKDIEDELGKDTVLNDLEKGYKFEGYKAVIYSKDFKGQYEARFTIKKELSNNPSLYSIDVKIYKNKYQENKNSLERINATFIK